MDIEIRLKVKILLALHRRNCWGGKHTSVENAIKGVPGHFVGMAKIAITDLIKNGMLMPKTTGYGFHISLNPRLKTEIENLITKYNNILFQKHEK